LTSSVHGDVVSRSQSHRLRCQLIMQQINGWQMRPTYNPCVGYHPDGGTISGPLNLHTIATTDLVPSPQYGGGLAIEVGGSSLHNYHSIVPVTGAIGGAQPGASTKGLALPENTERRNAISTMTSKSTSQSHTGDVIERIGVMIRHSAGRRGLPAEEFDGDISRLTGRLTIEGVDQTVVELCCVIFARGVSLEALKARMTRKECERHGLQSGMRYRMLLDVVKMAKGGVSMDRHVCRLCPRDEAVDYKNHRDALRHLLRDHFGIGFQCTRWLVLPSVRSEYR
jgi:hypothetical protein